MPSTADVLKSPPPVILVGGNNEYLVDQAFAEIRDTLVARNPQLQLESYPAGSDLSQIVDSFRTHSLFGGPRLLVAGEVNAFVTKKEVKSLLDKALTDWESSKTDRKRSSAVSKLLHILGLTGVDLEDSDATIASAIGAKNAPPLTDMLAAARTSGKRATRGEGDAAMLVEAVSRGGAPGAILLMRTGELPADSATIAAIERSGAVIRCDLSREAFGRALDQALAELAREAGVRLEAAAVTTLKRRLGIERMLTDKFNKDVPDLRVVLSEAERLATLAGSGGTITAAMVEDQIREVAGGARFEFTGLFVEGRAVEAIEKLRDLIDQARREDPKTPLDIQYGKFIFPLADEVRQLIAIRSFARLRKIDLKRRMNYNQFKDTWADALGEFMKEHQLVRQKPHPFPLSKKFEAAQKYSEEKLFTALSTLAEIDFWRKSGGAPIDVALESFVASFGRS
jgi:DNA polymerase III delta subunit